MTVYALIIYYPNTDKEPKVDVFDDEEWANNTAQIYKDRGWVVCVNPCHLYIAKEKKPTKPKSFDGGIDMAMVKLGRKAYAHE